MSGLGEILEENSRLREVVRERDGMLEHQAERFAAQLTAQAEQFAAQLTAQAEALATQAEKIEALKASNERFAQHFEFLEKIKGNGAALAA